MVKAHTRPARLAQAFHGLLLAGAALALAAAFATVIAGMVDRWFGLGLRGLDAYAGYAVAAALFLALPETLRRDEHLRVGLLLQRLPARGRAALEAWCLLAGLVLSVLLAGYACRLVWVSWQTHDISPASDMTPLWLPQTAMALGCLGLALAMAEAGLRRWRGLPPVADGLPRSNAAAHVE